MKTPMDQLLDTLEWKPGKPPEAANIDYGIPYATHEAVLKIGDAELRCYQLSDGRRIFHADDVLTFFGVETMGELIPAETDADRA